MTTGTTREWQAAMALVVPAAMEPRRDDGDDRGMPAATTALNLASPQWSPVVTTGTTRRPGGMTPETTVAWPQWSPVVTTGTTW